jgi:hypothetical protein
MSRHRNTHRHSVTIRPPDGIYPNELEHVKKLISNLLQEQTVLEAAIGLEYIQNREDSYHIHIRMILSRNRRSEWTTSKIKPLFPVGRLTPSAIKTTQPSRNLIDQTKEKFYSYALKDAYLNENHYWLFNVEMTAALRAECHELSLLTQEQAQRVPIHLVTTSNVDQMIQEYMNKHNLTHRNAFLQMYHSQNPIYRMQFLSSRIRIKLLKARQDNASDVDTILNNIWDNY